MKVYTKTGDKGSTALLGGERVPKNHIKLQAYGTIDELNSCLGKVRSELQHFVAPKSLSDSAPKNAALSSSSVTSTADASDSVSDDKESTWAEGLIPQLERIQKELFLLGSHIACVSEAHRQKFKLADFTSSFTQALEASIDQMDQELPALKNFILPGGHMAASSAHIARTVCRRAERWIYSIEDHSPEWLAYVNRLSDYCFVLARYINFKSQIDETIWSI